MSLDTLHMDERKDEQHQHHVHEIEARIYFLQDRLKKLLARPCPYETIDFHRVSSRRARHLEDLRQQARSKKKTEIARIQTLLQMEKQKLHEAQQVNSHAHEILVERTTSHIIPDKNAAVPMEGSRYAVRNAKQKERRKVKRNMRPQEKPLVHVHPDIAAMFGLESQDYFEDDMNQQKECALSPPVSTIVDSTPAGVRTLVRTIIIRVLPAPQQESPLQSPPSAQTNQ